jgi:serine/threonine-protein kinase
MGAVYRGEREAGEFRQQAAIKLIRLGLDQPELRRRFLRERQILAQLQHPNIATLLDGGVDERGAPYFAMELVDGLPIDQWCDRQRLEVRERVRLFLQVCSAVQHAHQHLAVHRDLKPGNILVTATGQTKLLDFGIAKLLAEGEGEGETETRDRPLTPEFAAPEQLHGQPITTATDQYALGVVLYQLLSGALPFATGGHDAWRSRLSVPGREPEPISRMAARATREQAQARRLSPASLATALRGDLAAIVHRALQAEPARRYPSIDALTADLKAWLDGRPVNARLGHRGYRLRKFVARHRFGVAAGLAALLAVGAALAVAMQQAAEARHQAELARANARRAETSAMRALSTRDFAVSLLTSASPVKAAKGTRTTAVELLQAAAQRVDEELEEAPEAQAELRATIGAGLYQQGERERGIELLDRGIAQMRELGVAGVPLVEALQSRAIASREGGDDDGAERDVRAALALLPQLPGDQRLRAIKLRTFMATIATQRGRLREALAINQANLRDRTALLGEGHEDTAVDWNNLGYAYVVLDRFPESEAAFQRADDILVAAKGADFPRRVWPLLGVGAARLGQGGRLALAAAAFDEAERVMRASLGDGHPIGLSLDINRATLQARHGRCDRAIPMYAAALARARELHEPRADQIEGSLGACLLEQGDTGAALIHLQTAVAGLARDRAVSEPTLNRMRSALGLARFRDGERARGEREVRAAAARLQAAGFARTEDFAEVAGDLAALLEADGRGGEAGAWRQRALQAFREVYGESHPFTAAARAALPPVAATDLPARATR